MRLLLGRFWLVKVAISYSSSSTVTISSETLSGSSRRKGGCLPLCCHMDCSLLPVMLFSAEERRAYVSKLTYVVVGGGLCFKFSFRRGVWVIFWDMTIFLSGHTLCVACHMWVYVAGVSTADTRVCVRVVGVKSYKHHLCLGSPA